MATNRPSWRGLRVKGSDGYTLNNTPVKYHTTQRFTWEIEATFDAIAGVINQSLGAMLLGGGDNAFYLRLYYVNSEWVLHASVRTSAGQNTVQTAGLGLVLQTGVRYKIKFTADDNLKNMTLSVETPDGTVYTKTNPYSNVGTLLDTYLRNIGFWLDADKRGIYGIIHSVKTYDKNNAIVESYSYESGVVPSNHILVGNAQQRPLGVKPARLAKLKPKKNLIKGFFSSDWVLHANAKAKKAYELELNATGQFQSSTFTLSVQGNQQYTLFAKNQELSHYYYGMQYDELGVAIGSTLFTTLNSAGNVTKTFTTSSNAKTLKVIATNVTATGKFVFKEPILIAGSYVDEFEPYQEVGKQSKKKAKKNLVRGESEQDNSLFLEGTGTSTNNNVWEGERLAVRNGSSNVHGRGQAINVEVGKTYTFSCNAQHASDSSAGKVFLGSTDKGSEYDIGYYPVTEQPVTFTATSDTLWVRFVRNGSTNADAPAYFWNIQLEEGSTATSYEPYIGLPKQAKQY